jgi:hypothetical protein
MADAASTAKAIADATVGNLNKATAFLLDLFDPQNKNLFELILYPANITFGLTAEDLKFLGQAALDTVIARLYVQSINVSFRDFEYQDYNELKGIRDIKYPDTISMTFIENELGFVRNYIRYWEKSIGDKSLLSEQFLFNNNQSITKKNGILVPLMGIGLPNPAVIRFIGLKFKSWGELTFSHGDGDPMLLTVNFSVDDVYWRTLSDLIP